MTFNICIIICNSLIQQRVNLLSTRLTDNNNHYKIMFMTVRVCSRFILDTPIIGGYMLLLLILSQIENGSAEQLQCIRFMNQSEMICRYSLKWVSLTKCCYNYEKEYFYCCPHPEARRLEYATRISGILIVAVLFIIMVILLCVFCTRCPVGRAINKRRIISRQVEEEML